MSIATKQQLQQQPHQQGQYLQLFRKINKEAQSTEPLTHTPPADGCTKKSIEFEIKSQEKKHVTREIKSKHLVRQKTPVAVIETEEKLSEDKKANSKSQEVDIIPVANGLEEVYYNEVGEPKDYQIYQNGQVNDFFKPGQFKKPSKISDICLVNDHYILVKMPDDIKEPDTKNPMSLAATKRLEFRALKENQEKISTEAPHRGNNKKLCRYLRSKQNRVTRIAPISEEPEDQSDFDNKSLKTQSKLDCLKLPYCWQANEQEVEIYETCTKICKTSQDLAATETKSPIKGIEKEECLQDYKTQDIQTISGSILKSSLQYKVTLHNYGSFVDSQNNNNINNVLELNRASRRKCPRLENFYWLLRPFRGKYRKPKPKIQAVVYKTYFVKWTKPPDTLSHGYGVRPSRSTEIDVSVLRRCRSAIF